MAAQLEDKYKGTIYGIEEDGTPCFRPPTSYAEGLSKHPHYVIHIREGGQIVNPESINPEQVTAGLIRDYEPYADGEEEPDDEGPPTFAFVYKDGRILLAANHPRCGIKPVKAEKNPVVEKKPAAPAAKKKAPKRKSATTAGPSESTQLPQNVTALNSHILATISGKLESSESMLKRLKDEMKKKKKGGRISVVEVTRLMANILAKRCEVGLIAGWDDKGAGLYRVDGMGVVIKGNRFASGSGLRMTYFNMRSHGGFSQWDTEMAAKAIIHVANRTRKGQVKNCEWPLTGVHGEGFASLYLVGSEGWEIAEDGEMDIKKRVKRCGFRRSGLHGEYVFV
ncbi:OLC1v1022493C1 [Oldenlandia corymbosa var. corymbosa]|uniref:OLC1v1022493C1 n=1 Tax=Oldenlandia corymbosa var. corymbosa TaxID=529605 RepID=A0AAV1BZB7_OLDCO|nr:OLC1v1022493C1 [Oldenlandia corymbosa var. corymbosa]